MSGTWYATDGEGTVAYVRQLLDNVVDWDDYFYIDDNGNHVYPFQNKTNLDKFQNKLNEIFLSHFVDFQKFLNTKGIDGVIDTWKDVQEFLEGISDSESMELMNIIRDIQLSSGQLNVRMSEDIPGSLEAVTTTDFMDIDNSYMDEETGALNIVYNFE